MVLPGLVTETRVSLPGASSTPYRQASLAEARMQADFSPRLTKLIDALI